MIKARTKIGLIALVSIGLSGCFSNFDQPNDPDYAPVIPEESYFAPPKINNGAIYQNGGGLGLFTDRRAHRVGDILTVELVESTQAGQKAETDANKTDDYSLTAVTLPFQSGPLQDGAAAYSSSSAFSGDGESKQQNSLNGKITVTVSEVLPNGNMVIRGEKWLTLTGGDEYIRLSGIVRPDDISPNNVVLSERIANPRITYRGKGAIAESNIPGWLGRFFRSALWPF